MGLICEVEGCGRPHHGKGLCRKHYDEVRNHGKIKQKEECSIKVCKIEGCNEKHHAKGYCERHYRQMKKYGKISSVKNNRRLPNEYIIHSDYVEIILYDKQGNKKEKTLIDLEDIEKVKDYKCGICSGNRVYILIDNKSIMLSRFIMDIHNEEFDWNKVVDHINGNPLDNRKENLRIVTQSQNGMNQGLPSNNTSGHIGVHFNKKTNKWIAQIGVKGKKISKSCNSKEEAITLREQWEEEYFGEFKRERGNK